MGLLLLPFFFLWLLFVLPAQRIGGEYVLEADRKAFAVGRIAACAFSLNILLLVATLAPFSGRRIGVDAALGTLVIGHFAIAITGWISLIFYRRNRRPGCLFFSAVAFVCVAAFPVAWFGLLAPAMRLLNVGFNY